MKKTPYGFHNNKIIVLSIIPIMLIASCGKKGDDKSAKPPDMPVPVKAAAAKVKDIPVEIRAIGTVEPYASVSIKSRVTGYLQKVHFEEGTDVKEGQTLFTIDPRPYQATLRQARAILARDTVQLENARLMASRYGQLTQEGFASQQDSDMTGNNAKALAEVVAADKALVEKARLDLSYCYIESPISGRAGAILMQKGNLIVANDGKAMVVINRLQPIYVDFAVPAQFLNEIKTRSGENKLTVEATIPQTETAPPVGELTFIDNAVDPATGTIHLKATFANDGNILWPGQFVSVVLKIATRPNAVVVPTQAVMTGQKGQFVFVVKADSSVEMRDVVSGLEFDGDSVIESGLSSGETVVIDGQLALSPGKKVSIKADEAAPAK